MTADRPHESGPVRALGPWVEVRTGSRHGVLAVSVVGEIDLTNHGDLERLLGSLDTSGAARVDLDLSMLTFSDARGACHLLGFVERVAASGSDVRITGARPPVSHVLSVLTHLPDSA